MDALRSGDGLLVEVVGPVATLTLDRPAQLNALTIPLKEALLRALRLVASDPTVRAVVLTGSGRAFCAGQDLAERAAPGAPSLDVELGERYNPIVELLRSMPQPVIVAVNGVAAGAGASLALACDLRIAAVGARFVLAFGGIGLVPDSGATWLLPRIVGAGRAAEIALLGEPIDADAALAIGLVGRVVAADELTETAQAVARRLAAGAPRAMALSKRLLADAWTADLAGALQAEAEAQGLAGATSDHAEGLAAFREKRPPRFTGE